MTVQVAAPGGGVTEQGTTRWQARAKTISETVTQLSRIWHAAAEGAASAEPGGDVKVRMRTSVLTLVVVAQQPEVAERALAIVGALASRHPSRAIIVSPGDPDGPTTFDARISAACQLAATSGAEICTEEILVRTGGELSQHLSTVIAPLLIHDLPVVLWWPDEPPFASRRFEDLADMCDGLLVDSGDFRGDGRRGLAGMAAVVATGRSVHDMGWARLSLWRELLAGLFDHPLLIDVLPGVRSLRVDIARPSASLRISKAACFSGWLAAMLGWEVATPLVASQSGDRLSGAFKIGKRQIPVEFRAIVAGHSSVPHSPGSLVRVEMELARGRATTRARVTRQADHLLATADWNGAQVARRAGQLERFDEMPFLAEALDRTSLDRIFERALGPAVELSGR
ncbi:MAG: glucose-6-phosphate dehydrogenase assembly protein OpcA [Chloroflexi bacterium]|nr:glucose-6-phosphate dehydrogenase assembly protein OpcA [Chloroflexota bacterium]